MRAARQQARTCNKPATAPFIAALAFLLAVATGPSSAAGGDLALGEYLSSECVACHSLTGQTTGGIPAIVAWPEDQFVAVLKSYKEKHRDNPTMQMIAARLTEEEMAALATYFASLQSRPKRK